MNSTQLNTYNIFKSFTTDTSLCLKRTYDGYPSSISAYCKFATSGSGNVYLPSFNALRSRSGLYLEPRYQYWLTSTFTNSYVPIISGIPTSVLSNSSQKIPTINDSTSIRTNGLSLVKASYSSGIYFYRINIYNSSSGTFDIYPAEGSSSSNRACIVSQSIETDAAVSYLQTLKYPVPVIYRIDHYSNRFTCYYRCNNYYNNIGQKGRTATIMLWVS